MFLLGAYPKLKILLISDDEILFFKKRVALLLGEFFKQSAKYNETFYGLKAQDVKETLIKFGKKEPWRDFSGLDDVEAQQKVMYNLKKGTKEQAKSEPDKYWWPGHHNYDPENPDGHYEKTYGLRYDQFITPLIKAIQELSAKVDKLEKA